MKSSLLLALAFTLLLTNVALAQTEFVKKLGTHVTCTTKSSESQGLSIRDKWAVIVSVGRYQDQSIEPLNYAKRNLLLLAKVLRNESSGRFLPDHVLNLCDSDATKVAVEKAILSNWLTKKALPNDLIVLYFCGRVIPKQDRSDLILCTWDTQAESADISGIPLKQTLLELKRKTQAKAVVCFLDLSLQGKHYQDNERAAQNTSSDPSNEYYRVLTEWAEAGKLAILSANKLGEPSCEHLLTGSSCFTHYLADGLEAGLGTITLQAVAQYVKQNVESDVQKQFSKRQTPLMVVPRDLSQLKDIVIGMPVRNKNYLACDVSVGHPLGEPAVKRPDFLAYKDKATHTKSNGYGDDDGDEDFLAPVDFGPYMAKMKRDIQAKWSPPKGFEDRKVVTVFSILRDGTIKGAEIVRGSGVESVDERALEALDRASPLAPLPKGAPKSVRIRYQFDWRVAPR